MSNEKAVVPFSIANEDALLEVSVIDDSEDKNPPLLSDCTLAKLRTKVDHAAETWEMLSRKVPLTFLVTTVSGQ
jgi:hypothetical protein